MSSIHDNGREGTDARAPTDEEQIKAYYDERYKVLVLGDKNPFNPYRADGKEWQKEHVLQEDALAHYRKGGNIGLQMGEVSGWLCAEDLDDEVLRRLARHFLRDTLKAGKEKEAFPSFYVYRSAGADYLQIKDIGGKEFLALKAAGHGQGHQIKVAPSVHPKKGRYRWIPAFDPSKILDAGAESLIADTRRLAVAGLIRKYLPEEGRHEYAKAVAGTLLRKGYDEHDLAETMTVIWEDAEAPRKGR